MMMNEGIMFENTTTSTIVHIGTAFLLLKKDGRRAYSITSNRQNLF